MQLRIQDPTFVSMQKDTFLFGFAGLSVAALFVDAPEKTTVSWAHWFHIEKATFKLPRFGLFETDNKNGVSNLEPLETG